MSRKYNVLLFICLIIRIDILQEELAVQSGHVRAALIVALACAMEFISVPRET